MSRTSRLVVLASILTAAAVLGVGTVVVVSARTAVAEEQVDARREAALRRTPDQVVTGALDTADPRGTTDRAGAVPFAYAGDSITARPDSWLHVLADDPAVRAVGGYAHSGYRSDQVLREITPVPEASVLVVELGTNDVNQAVPTRTTIENIGALVRKVRAQRVLLVAGPPSDRTSSLWGVDRRAEQVVLSRALRADARQHGWSYVDPFAALRLPDGGWVHGTSRDGIHPTAEASRTVARAMADAIEATAH